MLLLDIAFSFIYDLPSQTNIFFLRCVFRFSSFMAKNRSFPAHLNAVFAINPVLCYVVQLGPTFYQLYHNPTYWGRFARQFLMPPITVHKYDKTTLGSPRVSVNLPPRISFRRCASFKFIWYFIIGALIAWLLDYRFDVYLFILISSFLLYKMLKAIPKNCANSARHGYPTQGFGNISFSDSF